MSFQKGSGALKAPLDGGEDQTKEGCDSCGNRGLLLVLAALPLALSEHKSGPRQYRL